jgi:hypothetical protein
VLKIVVTGSATEGPVLRLEGQIIGPWVDELRRTCDELPAGPITLDLAQVSFVERRGVELLWMLGTRGASLLHCSPFVVEQLKVTT